MTEVIDIRKHDPKKVTEYWKSKGGVDRGFGYDLAFPYVGISPLAGDILGYPSEWSHATNILDNYFKLIDPPKDDEEHKVGDWIYVWCGNERKKVKVRFVADLSKIDTAKESFPIITMDENGFLENLKFSRK
jgi:hypothetical protein